MAVRTFEVKRVFMQKLFCDKCNDVEMQPHLPAIALSKGGPQRYTLMCPKCKSKSIVDKPYPLQTFEVIEVEAVPVSDVSAVSESLDKNVDEEIPKAVN